jgi:hypothetical protein
MNFSTSQLALVAYASVSGSDASLTESNGFVASTKISTGTSLLFLSTALSQDLVAGKCHDLLSVTPGKSDGSFIARGVSAANITSTAIQVVLASDTVGNTDFTIMVFRTVLPPQTP